MPEDIWAGVRERVLRLGRLRGVDKVFGARGHGFRLGAVMGEGEVLALEADLGGSLPEEYRSFLLSVGRGGAGPDYGLMTPVLGDGGWQWRGVGLAFASQATTAEFAGRPFVAEALQSELDTLEMQEPTQDGYTDDGEFRRAHAAWDARYDELSDAQEAGVVFLSEQGCGYASLLVMTGPHRGAIWEDLRPVDGGMAPSGHAFARWYLRWLERTERELEVAATDA